MEQNEIARGVAFDEVEIWRLAVELQQQRIITGNRDLKDLLGPTPSHVDLRLYAVALRNLIRAVDLSARMYPQCEAALRQALRRFNDAVPRARDVRDVLEHFDDYAQADHQRMGRLIKRHGGLPPIEGFSFSPGGIVMTITIYREDEDDFAVADELRLDTSAATRAALELADETLKLLDSVWTLAGRRRR